MTERSCAKCGGFGYNFTAGSSAKEKCLACKGTGYVDDGKWSPMEATPGIVFALGISTLIGGIVATIADYWQAIASVIVRLAKLGPWAVPAIGIILIGLVATIEGVRFFVTRNRRLRRAVIAKLHGGLDG